MFTIYNIIVIEHISNHTNTINRTTGYLMVVMVSLVLFVTSIIPIVLLLLVQLCSITISVTAVSTAPSGGACTAGIVCYQH